ncbi:hypothetical protein N7532_010276 [Penicillium argentinense]|uniref:Uncharacterized protein n=1 Tax=Penicillium argentinense TaxID=1131581 RepID=A0A9W9EPH5_9EURO|nr:uncharacterized protein N7532_010276 [Penicillium argentinense]KAJ5085505.1 hypothetical protein N7532_010276 [Penicillium argentinense]
MLSIPAFTVNPQTPSTPTAIDSDHEYPVQPGAFETQYRYPIDRPRYGPYKQDPVTPEADQTPMPTNYQIHAPRPVLPINAENQTGPTGKEEVLDASIKASLHYTDSRNAFLIECKRRGLSYKDIKRMGGFKEAESTLRGRFRTLTKAKEQRIQLLCKAVAIFTDKSFSEYVADTRTHGAATAHMQQMQVQVQLQQPPKVSWKKVAQYIWNNGGSYQFGNATCKKKYCEIHDISY